MRPYVLLLLPLLAACDSGSSSRTPPGTPDQTAATKPAPLAVAEPQLFAGSDWVLYPLPLPGAERTVENEYGSSYSSGEAAHYWQVLFYNARTGQTRQLAAGHRLLVRAISPGQGPDEHLPAAVVASYAPSPYTPQNLLLYLVTTTDFDRDGRLTTDDPAYLFVSTKAGEAFRQVSPDSLHVESWQIQPTTGRLLLQARRDTNHDHRFTPTDELAPYVADLATGQPAAPVLPSPLARQLQRQKAQLWPAH